MVKKRKPIIRLDDTKYNRTKARVFLMLAAVRQTDGRYLTRRAVADMGAASEGYLRGRLWWYEWRGDITTKPLEQGRHARGRSYLKGYRIAPKGIKYLKDLWEHHPERMAALCRELDINVVWE